MILIEPGRTPWGHVSGYFERYFGGPYRLTGGERSMILKFVDESCPTIDLQSEKPRFGAGEVIYLTEERIREIAQTVREKQAQEFGAEDYVKIIEAGDSPGKFIQESFEIEAEKMGVTLAVHDLDKLEVDYLLKALQACSKEVDLTISGDGQNRRYARFMTGDRMIFRKEDLQKCIIVIAKKHQQQAPTDQDSVPVVTEKSDGVVKFETVKIEPKVKAVIDSVYPGNNIDEILARNALYYIWVNEQGRGALRSMAKSLYWGSKSVGEFQLRVSMQDIENCRQRLEKLGIKVPKDHGELKELVEDNDKAAAIVAGQRVLDMARSFQNFMSANGETVIEELNQNFMLMLTTSYNRSQEAIYRAVFQNWAYKLAEAAGVESRVKSSEIDSVLDEAEKKEMLHTNILVTFENVAKKLIGEGKVTFQGDIRAELGKMFTDKIAFVRSPLFQELQKWYLSATGKRLEFTFSNEDLARGKGIFSYGARVLSRPGEYTTRFKDYDGLRSSIALLQAPYQPETYKPQKVVLPAVSNEPNVSQRVSEQLIKDLGINNLFQPGGRVLNVYTKAVNLRTKPNGPIIEQVKFGHGVLVEGVQRLGSRVWMKVKVVSSEGQGADGYMVFEPEWFDNNKIPQILPELKDQLVAMERSSEAPLPTDYQSVLSQYLKFIDNLNPLETMVSAKLMPKSKPTARIVKDDEEMAAVKALARNYGDSEQRFFGVLPKKGGMGIAPQTFYLIDNSENRILAFNISTGKPGHETPAGKYHSGSFGYNRLDKFGGHQGSYIKRYSGHRVENYAGSAQEYANGRKVYASMTTGIVPIQREAEQKSKGLYFHGTNRENRLGTKASGGCIRMSNIDLVYLNGLLNGAKLDFQVIENREEMAKVLRKENMVVAMAK